MCQHTANRLLVLAGATGQDTWCMSEPNKTCTKTLHFGHVKSCVTKRGFGCAGLIPITISPSLQFNVSAQLDAKGAVMVQGGVDFTSDVVLGVEFRRAWNT